MSVLSVLRESWSNRTTLGDSNNTRDLAAFLPPALEIQETPPNPLVAWLARTLMLLLVLAITWACVGNINIVASADGKLIPSSRVKQIQPLSKGVVKAIYVSEGNFVSKGAPLIELETTLTQADQNRLQTELLATQLNVELNQALLKAIEVYSGSARELSEQSINKTFLNHPKSYKPLYDTLLIQTWRQYMAQLKGLESALDKNTAEQAATSENITKLKQTLPIVTRRTQKLKDLYDKEYVSEIDYLESEQERIQQFQDLRAAKQQLKSIQAAASEVEQQLKLHTAQFAGGLIKELAEYNRQLSAIQEELEKATDINAKQILYSPVAGHVQELVVSTVGGVVTDAQQLMLIIPDDGFLEAEVLLPNKDIGFVQEGMAAEIKVHTFPFTKYGLIEAEITSVSDDAIVNEDGSLMFRMQLKLAKNTLLVNGNKVKLQPGMSITAEARTGKRKVIEFFMAPLLKMKAESIRER